MRELLVWVIPLGFGASLLTCALLAHRGQRFWGTWMMLISSALFVLLIIAMAALTFLSLNSAYHEVFDSSGVVFILITLALLAYALGFFGICSKWQSICQTAANLEAQAAILAAEGD